MPWFLNIALKQIITLKQIAKLTADTRMLADALHWALQGLMKWNIENEPYTKYYRTY